MKIILSLETEEALDVFPYLGQYVDGVKINHLLWNEVDFNIEKDKELFVDFKLWDTPNTVKTVVESIIKKGGTMTTISTFNNESVFGELEQFKDDIKLLAQDMLDNLNNIKLKKEEQNILDEFMEKYFLPVQFTNKYTKYDGLNNSGKISWRFVKKHKYLLES